MKFLLSSLFFFATQSPLGAAQTQLTADQLPDGLAVNPTSKNGKTDFDFALWCCHDSGDACSDACDWVNDCDNQKAFGIVDHYQMYYTGAGNNPIIYTPKYVFDEATQCFTFGVVLNNVGVCENCENIADPDGPSITPAEVSVQCRDPAIFDMGWDSATHWAGKGPPGIKYPARTYYEATTQTGRLNFQCCAEGGVCGDPHFKSWGGKTYDYQGECDLMFVDAPHFAKGLGLKIHIRTKVRYNYSFIESAAVQIGDSILEIAGWGEHVLDGVGGAEMPAMMGEIPVSYHGNKKQHVYEIDVSGVVGQPDQRIVIKTFKDWVSINIDQTQKEDFTGSTGMLGEFPTGRLLGRDGVTDMKADTDAFGQEWQILSEQDGSLFQNVGRAPQHPQQCVMPVPVAQSTDIRRRLSAGMVTEEEAQKACAHQATHQEFCIYDVLATGDLEMAAAGAY